MAASCTNWSIRWTAAKWAVSRLRISAEVAAGETAIVIEDDGPGLADDKVPEALRPGQKLDESAQGFGFGLPSRTSSPSCTRARPLGFRRGQGDAQAPRRRTIGIGETGPQARMCPRQLGCASAPYSLWPPGGSL